MGYTYKRLDMYFKLCFMGLFVKFSVTTLISISFLLGIDESVSTLSFIDLDKILWVQNIFYPIHYFLR